MQTIWKFHIKKTDRQIIEMPLGSKILTVGVQGGMAYLWAMVDTEREATEAHHIAMIGTGYPMSAESGATYLGTLHMPPFVWHVFEI